MCGPLAVLLAPQKEQTGSFLTASVCYQSARVLSYTAVGALAGGVGLLALGWVEIYSHSIARFLPWALVLFFLAVALRADQWLPKNTGLAHWFYRKTGQLLRLPRWAAGGIVGVVTPLLPCGPLYMVFGLALMTQSPVRGAEFLLAFGLGTLPLLWLVQQQYVHWSARLTPKLVGRLQRGIAAAAVLILGARLLIFEFTNEAGLFCDL